MLLVAFKLVSWVDVHLILKVDWGRVGKSSPGAFLLLMTVPDFSVAEGVNRSCRERVEVGGGKQ